MKSYRYCIKIKQYSIILSFKVVAEDFARCSSSPHTPTMSSQNKVTIVNLKLSDVFKFHDDSSLQCMGYLQIIRKFQTCFGQNTKIEFLIFENFFRIFYPQEKEKIFSENTCLWSFLNFYLCWQPLKPQKKG